MKAIRDLYVLVNNPDTKEPLVGHRGQVFVTVADSREEAVVNLRHLTGNSGITTEYVVSCSIHHGRSALYIKR